MRVLSTRAIAAAHGSDASDASKWLLVMFNRLPFWTRVGLLNCPEIVWI
jgi:hypothetical protein